MSNNLPNNQQIFLSYFSKIITKFKASKGAQLSLKIDLLQPVREWLDNLEIRDPKLATFLYKSIPAQCPFAREIKIFGYKIGQIPPLCKLNPLYDQLMSLRFRAMCYLVDECGLDLQSFA